MFEPLPDDLRVHLQPAAETLGTFARLRYASSVDSTNDLALTLALAGEPEGASVLADHQRAGRGRRGREWFSPAGAGLYLSVVLRPAGGVSAPSMITLAAGVAAARAVRASTQLPIELKWPNDLVIGRPWRKAGGILSEAASAGARLDAVVVGIGINVSAASYPRELAARATALEVELGRAVDRGALVVELLRALRAIMEPLHAGRATEIRDAWCELGGAGLRRERVRWSDGRGERHGRAVDLDVDGALVVDVEGRTERVIAGEVIWESLSRG
jgi:BirA family biotin operon repressor/biotin-[acetyl-CoA-carboxylase] ligase